VDNLKLDDDGNLWVGCQPRLAEVVQYINDFLHLKCSSTVSPSVQQ